MMYNFPVVSGSRHSSWPSVLLAVCILLLAVPQVVLGMTFTTLNAEQASMYQTIQVNMASNPLNNKDDPYITTGDRFYAIASTGGSCVADPDAATTTFYTMTRADTDGFSGRADVTITDTVFTVGNAYAFCYLSQTAGKPPRQVLRQSASAGSTALVVWPPIYQALAMKPTQPNGGEGVVTLTITETVQEGRPTNAGLAQAYTVFLPPCSAQGTDCADKNALAAACARIGSSMTSDVVRLSGLHSPSANTVAGGFTAPFAMEERQYYACVPYCPAAGNCGTNTVGMSYTLVAAAEHKVIFGAANPGLYTRSPSNPQAREMGVMTFTGTGLSDQDRVRVIASGQSCTANSPTLMENLAVGKVTSTDPTKATATFVLEELVTAVTRGRVCYFHAASGLWSSAYQNAAEQQADFTIDILQPTAVTLAPANPTVGQSFTITFTGTALNGAEDSAFLTSSQAKNPCAVTEGSNVFPCAMTGAATPSCTAVVDPEGNQGITVSVCYRKQSRTENYAQINAVITLGDRNPTYTMTPYPVYAGQTASIIFTGTKLSTSDVVQVMNFDAMCGSGDTLDNVFLSAATEVTAGTVYRYDIVGAPDVCFKVCYRLADSTEWVAARSSSASSANSNPNCPNAAVFIGAFPMRYQLSSGTTLSAKETATVSFTPNSMSLANIKVVRSEENCVLKFCDGTAACAKAAAKEDYAGAVLSNAASVMVGAEGAHVILCVSVSNGGAFIPVLPFGADAAYGFISDKQNPKLTSAVPENWHVSMATLTTTFEGDSLDPAADRVFAVASSALAYNSDGVVVCPPPRSSTIVTSLVSSTQSSASSDKSVVVEYTRSDALETDFEVFLCYRWMDGTNARMIYTGSKKFAAKVPAEVIYNQQPEGGYRAGDSMSMTFTSTTAVQLSATEDAVYFYRYAKSTGRDVNCYCNPTACNEGTRVTYEEATMSASTAPSGVMYGNPQGFNNYNVDSVFVVCYKVNALSDADMYVGRLDVAMANPVYYTMWSADGITNRVGAIMAIKARRCLFGERCQALTSDDSMLLVPAATQCADVTTEPVDVVQRVGDPEIGLNGYTYQQAFVVDVQGEYRVCYRHASNADGLYNELVFDNTYTRKTLPVIDANPSAFTPVPLQPSANQFITVELTCDGTLCNACRMLSIVPGVRSSCWTEEENTFRSTACTEHTKIEFPNAFIGAGSYTICYGEGSSARRIPGVFVVTDANPVTYLPVDVDARDILTNQVSDFVLDIVGTNLKVGDSAFLLTSAHYTCHDLRTGDIQKDGNLAAWLAPSVDPYPLTSTQTGTSWVVSNQKKRFDIGMLMDSEICPGDGSPCTMQLCYMREGTSWAPVPIETPPDVRIVASNPSSITFDRYPLFLDMYVMVTVAGADLKEEDQVFIHSGDTCSGARVTVMTEKPVVNEDGAEWITVIRFTDMAASYTVCYWQGDSPTEIVIIELPNQKDPVINVLKPLYIQLVSDVFPTTRFPISRFEEMIVSGSLANDGDSPLALSETYMISADVKVAECNYGPFLSVADRGPAYPVVEKFTQVPNKETAFQGRLAMPAGTYAFCMMSKEYGLFRVTTFPPDATRADGDNDIVIRETNPASYVAAPSIPTIGQSMTITFTSPENVAADGGAALAVGDAITIIDGSLFECGFDNSTEMVGQGAVSEVNAAGAAIVNLQLSALGDYAAKSLTVCYRKTGGTFATVPRPDFKEDKNLLIMVQIPARWTTLPQQAQAGAPLKVTFYGEETDKDYLEVGDKAFLVKQESADVVPTTALCETSEAAFSSTAMTMDGINTVWQIPRDVLVEGKYFFCYTAVKNGRPVYVANAPLLTVYPLQSPTGAYTNHEDSMDVRRGERFFLFFKTTEPLNVILDDGIVPATELQNKDVVRISAQADCSNPLKADDVAAIPSSFGYRTLDDKVPNTDINVPYIQLRMRAPTGTYYVCMQRTGRAAWQAYYDSSVVGGEVNPAILTLKEAPITAFTATPVSPRAWVGGTKIALTLSTGITAADVSELFFVTYEGESVEQSDEILYDNCYRPPTRDDASGPNVKLVDRRLQVNLDTMVTDYPFDNAGTYLLCYKAVGADSFYASVFPSALAVANPSPTTYAVPRVLAIEATFTMTFAALDPIFSQPNNLAAIFVSPEDADPEALPSCAGAQPPEGGTSSFNTFTVASGISASVEPLILVEGHYFVCFTTNGQTTSFPVPNAAGGYLFSVGLTGAKKYTVNPPQPYLGQQLDLVITGNDLSNADHVKIVEVPSAGEPDYAASCTAEAVNADASQPAGSTVGSVVAPTTPLLAHYYPRVNKEGRFILCYQSGPLGERWWYVEDVPFFNVGPAHPTAYELLPDPVYETQLAQLVIIDTAGLLGPLGEVKLVAPSANKNTFVCTSNAPNSPEVGLISYVAEGSTNNKAIYRVCGKSAASVVVCYRLPGTSAWAEVPLSSPPPAYQNVAFKADPFTGPALVPASPRPYERFAFSFTSSDNAVAVTFVKFSAAPRTTCSEDVTYIEPLFYEKTATSSNAFSVALPAPGDYVVHLRMTNNENDPTITHTTLLTVGQCDPCSVVPPYGFVGEEATLSFPSTAGGSLTKEDGLRLIPVSQGLNDLPCDSPTGPFADVTFSPDSVEDGGNLAKYLVQLGKEEESDTYLGQYHLCYRKGADGAFAIVANDKGVPATFSVYPLDLTEATTCPDAEELYALETVEITLKAKDPVMFPNVDFSEKDTLVLVPLTALPAEWTCEQFPGVEQWVADGHRVLVPLFDGVEQGTSHWHATLPGTADNILYRVCFRLQYDKTFHSATADALLVHPENPYSVTSTPPVILPESPNVVITITGAGLLPTDDVYVVAAGTSCAETCTHPITPAEWTGVPYEKQYVSNSIYTISFGEPVMDTVNIGICYRRTGHYLTRLSNIHIGDPNPTKWSNNFVPRVGTRPTVTFTGTDLTNADEIMIVPAGSSCIDRNSIAIGKFVSVSENKQSSKLFLPLIDVPVGKYTMCYKISTVNGFGIVEPDYEVFPGGPSAFVTSNTAMQGRAFVMSFPVPETNPYTPQLNDEAFIACTGCSCFDEKHAVPAYGTVTGKLADLEKPIAIRVGFSTKDTYPVCYKLADSGFAQVGSIKHFLVMTPASPSAVDIFPTTPFQGQRLDYTFKTYTAQVPLATNDRVMLVRAGRTCWENEVMNEKDVIVQPTDVAKDNDDGKWKAHVPSLGPNTPPAGSFPLSYALCYRQGSQEEFVSVPFPEGNGFTMRRAEPLTFTSVPASVQTGMIGIELTFPNAKEGDEAYIVQFTELTDTVCTDESSVILAPKAAAQPKYVFSMPGNVIPSANTVALCYIKKDASVAEVPQLLPVLEGNPSDYESDAVDGRERQYITFKVHGTDLSLDTDQVVFTDVPCGKAPTPMQSSAAVARMSGKTLSEDATTLSFTAQFIYESAPITVYMCYFHDDMWREVGAPLVLEAPKPSTAVLYSASGNGIPRAGQHLFVELVDGYEDTPKAAGVLASGDGPGTWCNDFTKDDEREPFMIIEDAVLLSFPLWQHAGTSRLCLRETDDTLWSDVAATVDGPSLPEVGPPNPSSMSSFPHPPRVGQSVTLTFKLIVAPTAGDVVRITAWSDTEPCESAPSYEGFPASMPVEIVDETSTKITLVDSTDPLAYFSFHDVSEYRACYYSGAESAWSVVGGTKAAGTLNVLQRVPQSWEVTSGELVQGESFTLTFVDDDGVLNAEKNKAWAAPSNQNCGVDPADCPTCIVFELDKDKSTEKSVVTKPVQSMIVGDMNLCYTLEDATASLVPGELVIAAGPIECVETNTVTIGMKQSVTFRVRSGEDTTADSWRVSFYATTTGNCAEHYVPEFEPTIVEKTGSTDTSVTYDLQWPVDVRDERYTVCYTHLDKTAPVCTCDQLDDKSGECFISTRAVSPSDYTPSPYPAYVGQTITLNFHLTADQVMHPPTAVKFVLYDSPRASCDDDEAFTPRSPKMDKVDEHTFAYSFQHDYKEGPSKLMVCAQSDMEPKFVQVLSTIKDEATFLLIRPYMTLSSFPSDAAYLRAMQTLSLTFTHQEKEAIDVVSTEDQFTVVSDPYDCTETFINAQDPDKVVLAFELQDCSFITMPADVSKVDAKAFRTETTATFSVAGAGEHYFCYKLEKGTWAPVLPMLTVGPSLTTGCTTTPPVSPDNSADESLRAMQYIRTTINGDAEFTAAYSESDAVRVVPQNEMCTSDSAVVFATGTHRADATVSTVAFAPQAGTYKVCYRLGGSDSKVANWSPVCINIEVTAPTPTASSTGCFNQGQTLEAKLTQRDTFTFNVADTVRYVAGNQACINPDGSAVASSATVTVNDAVQAAAGLALGAGATGQTTFDVPYALFGTGTTAVRMCYKDAAGNQFAVPLDFEAKPAASSFAVQARQPASLKTVARLQMGQRIVMNFESAGGAVSPTLAPISAPPTPLVPGTAWSEGVAWDSAVLLPITSNNAYREGRCTAAARTSADKMASLGLKAVFGTGAKPDYTVGVYDPNAAQYYIACYKPATCDAEDIDSPVRVFPYNPSSVDLNVPAPRRGQLLVITFNRDTSEGASALTPGSDRALKQANLASCWTLPDDSGTVVEGSQSQTHINTIFPAQNPAQASDTTTRTCYKLKEGSWSEVPNGVAPVLKANPSSFFTVPTTARQFQRNTLTFTGVGLGPEDVVKVIAVSEYCSDASVPPEGFVAYAKDKSPIDGTNTGWRVASATEDGTTSSIDFSSTKTGEFSVCYKLRTDTVWTLVYSNLNVYERNPIDITQTPISTLEAELFTVEFTASTKPSGGASGLTALDRVALYWGKDVECLAPKQQPVIEAEPSRKDWLPNRIAFQLAAGTRGDYTLCYLHGTQKAGENEITFSPSWGFPEVVVQPNPNSLALFPKLTAEESRVEMLFSLVFGGFGLIATDTKTDSVKLIPSTNTYSDASCLSQESPKNVVFYPLYANGTHGVQVFRLDNTVPTGGSFWVCYKLNGGQYHIIGDKDKPIAITAAASPTSATSPKQGKEVYNGEAMDWTLAGNTAGCTEGDILFYSTTGCSDLPYYASAVTPDTMDVVFPLGATPITCPGTDPISVRISPLLDHKEGATLSLCYYHYSETSGGTVSVVVNEAAHVVPGVPPILQKSLTAPVQTVVTFDLAVSPSPTDYVVLVDKQENCRGVEAPKDSALFTDKAYDAKTGKTTVSTSVGTVGTYYICYSHQTGECEPANKRDCARIVGTLVATPNAVTTWTATPTPTYTSQTLSVVLEGSNEKSSAWMRWMSADTSDGATVSMEDVRTACSIPTTDTKVPYVPLTVADAAAGKWSSPMLRVSGRFALCYRDGPNDPITLFFPAKKAGPIVLLSTVSKVNLPADLVTGTSIPIGLQGGGLSVDDTVVAVGVPSASPIPKDICSNAAYVPRVPGQAPNGAGHGNPEMTWTFSFEQPGSYVLCYTPGSVAGEPVPVLITSTAFTVSGSGLSVSVVGTTQLVGVPLELLFTGSNNFAITDLASLRFIGNLDPTDVTVEKVCADATGYTAMTSVSADGTSANYMTTPTQAGQHRVCYRKSAATEPVLLSATIVISVKTAVAATFEVQPSGCKTLLLCEGQPTVTLLNAEHQPTSAPATTASLRLAYASDGSNAPTSFLTGSDVYVNRGNSKFEFYAIRVSMPGQYVLVATLTLVDGQTIETRSNAFSVENGDAVQNVASLACDPVAMALDRSAPISCTVTTLRANGPTKFSVHNNAGTATECAAADPTAEGLARCVFTVTPSSTDAIFVNYIAIAVEPEDDAFQRWPVTGSPVIIRLPTFPSLSSSLQCQGSDPKLPADCVYAGTALTCSVQGRAMVGGIVMPVVAPPNTLRVGVSLDGNAASAVNIGEFPTDPNGRYVFNVPVNPSFTLSVTGDVAANMGGANWQPMEGSPHRFTVLGVPSAQSTLTCTSQYTGSHVWFTPQDAMLCVVTLAGSNGAPVNSLASALSVSMPNGGTFKPLDPAAVNSTMDISATAPAVADVPSSNSKMARAALDWTFNMLVAYSPISNTEPIAQATGSMVYVTAVGTVPQFNRGETAALQLTGYGLISKHHYAAASTGDCTGIVTAASARETTTDGQIELRFTVPSADTFYICFAPEDAPAHLRRLTTDAYTTVMVSPKWSSADLALLIVGVILLAILLVLLLILLWCLCCGKQRNAKQRRAVYMPPRPNDRFVYRSGALPIAAPPAPAVAQAMTNNGVDSTNVRINIQDQLAQQQQQQQQSASNANIPPPLQPHAIAASHSDPSGAQLSGDAVFFRSEKKKKHRRHHRHSSPTVVPGDGDAPAKGYVDLDGSAITSGSYSVSTPYTDTSGSRPRSIPPLPPPPNSSQPQPQQQQQRQDSSLPPLPRPPVVVSGPYQHLHHTPLQMQTQEEEPNAGRVTAPPPMPASSNSDSTSPVVTVAPPTFAASVEVEDDEMAGPFVVAGHTSRPMARSRK